MTKDASICYHLDRTLLNLNDSDLGQRALSKSLRILSWQQIEKSQIIEFCLEGNLTGLIGTHQFLLNLKDWLDHIDLSFSW